MIVYQKYFHMCYFILTAFKNHVVITTPDFTDEGIEAQ